MTHPGEKETNPSKQENIKHKPIQKIKRLEKLLTWKSKKKTRLRRFIEVSKELNPEIVPYLLNNLAKLEPIVKNNTKEERYQDKQEKLENEFENLRIFDTAKEKYYKKRLSE
jgi:hypothetical protein